MSSQLPTDMGVVKKTHVQAYQSNRTLLSVLMEGTDYGIEIVFELHQGEPRERTQVYLLELLSVTTADTREPVEITQEYKLEAMRVVSDWVERNEKISADYRDF